MTTEIVEYSQTEQALATLREKYRDVVFDVSTGKGMTAAKEARAELRGLRTTLEKRRQEIKAPALDRCRMIDAEAKRITAELSKLEDPIDERIKAEEARKEEERLARLEAERQRLQAINDKIDAIRALPGTLIGKPVVILQGQIAKLRAQPPFEEEFAELLGTAKDAHTAAIARIEDQLRAQQEHEAEAARIKAEREELERLREADRLRREEEERKAAEARAEAERQDRERREAEQRRVNAISARIDGIRAMAANMDGRSIAELKETRQALIVAMHPDRSGVDFGEFKDQAQDAWDTAEATLSQAIEGRERHEQERQQREAEEQARREEEARQRAAQEARMQAERERLAEERRQFEERQAEQRRKEAEARDKAEAERLENLTVREAAQAVVNYFQGEEFEATGQPVPRCVSELDTVLNNEAKREREAAHARKKAASA